MNSVYDQILGLIPQVQIRKLLRYANSQIRKFSQNTAQQCLKTVLKIVFLFNFYYVQILIRVLYAIFVKRKSLYLRTCGSFQFLITKKTGPQIRKMSHFLRKVRKLTNYLKVPSHQIRSAWKWYDWIGLNEYKDRGRFFNVVSIFLFSLCNPSGIAKHDLLCVQFADSAGKLLPGL